MVPPKASSHFNEGFPTNKPSILVTTPPPPPPSFGNTPKWREKKHLDLANRETAHGAG